MGMTTSAEIQSRREIRRIGDLVFFLNQNFRITRSSESNPISSFSISGPKLIRA